MVAIPRYDTTPFDYVKVPVLVVWYQLATPKGSPVFKTWQISSWIVKSFGKQKVGTCFEDAD